MKLSNIGLVSVLGSLGVIASSMSAQALDFTFKFTGTQAGGPSPGEVTGIIMMPNATGSGTETVTSATMKILTSPNSKYLSSNIGTYDLKGGGFTLTGGNITGVSTTTYFSRIFNNIDHHLDLNYVKNGVGYNGLNNSGTWATVAYDTSNSGGFSGVQYTATAVPFDFNPTEGAALGIPLFIGLGVLRKKKLARKSAAIKIAETVS